MFTSKIIIFGKKGFTGNYERFFKTLPYAEIKTSLDLNELKSCSLLVLPGGGDINPFFFGEPNRDSRDIDTGLDLLQFRALDRCVRSHIPVLGICKGMQVINVAFGGTLIQNLPTADIHQFQDQDQYHATRIAPGSPLAGLFGETMTVNSAHHQAVRKPGKGLYPVQWCLEDCCIEAIMHRRLPVFGLQWHPERLKGINAPNLLLQIFPNWNILKKRQA